MSEPLSTTERALLRVFRQKDTTALPARVLIEAVVLSGGAPALDGAIETALLGLQVRGLIEPGPDPFSATSWMLTDLGEEVVNPEAEN